MQANSDLILAAGTVPWRYTNKGNIKVLLIRRVKYNDWSFPKGKLDPGESLPVAAVRETFEEIGLDLSLGAPLGTINYTVGDNLRKTVQYWASHVTKQQYDRYTFVPNKEVKRVKWVSVDEVAEKLTYPADRELFGVFTDLVKAGVHDTFTITLLRHAKAQPRGSEYPVDHKRPLHPYGEVQASLIIPTLAAFAPATIITSTAKRCKDTVKPLAEHLSLKVRKTDAISQDRWDEGDVDGLRELVAKVIGRGENALLCSHRPVLPDLAREIAAVGKSRPGRYLTEATQLPPGAFSIFHIAHAPSDHGIVSVEIYPIKP